jgi:hypothetical protein
MLILTLFSSVFFANQAFHILILEFHSCLGLSKTTMTEVNPSGSIAFCGKIRRILFLHGCRSSQKMPRPRSGRSIVLPSSVPSGGRVFQLELLEGVIGIDSIVLELTIER